MRGEAKPKKVLPTSLPHTSYYKVPYVLMTHFMNMTFTTTGTKQTTQVGTLGRNMK